MKTIAVAVQAQALVLAGCASGRMCLGPAARH